MKRSELRTPYFLVDEKRSDSESGDVKRRSRGGSGCRILLAQKAFSMFSVYPLIRKYLAGSTASGLYEARLGAKKNLAGRRMCSLRLTGKTNLRNCLTYADHLVFNSPSRSFEKYSPRARALGKEIGLRINPECSTQEGHAIYDPCAPGSRLGTTLEQFEEELLPASGSACIFIRSANRILMIWRPRQRHLRRNFGKYLSSDEMGQFRRRPSYYEKGL